MATRTASGQPLHTNLPCFTSPATRKLMHVPAMGSPPSLRFSRGAVLIRPGCCFPWGRLINLTKFYLRAHHGCEVFPDEMPPGMPGGSGKPCQMKKK
jgi:hypothetical protein